MKLCDGCNVNGNWEHRCHGSDVCECVSCREVERLLDSGYQATTGVHPPSPIGTYTTNTSSTQDVTFESIKAAVDKANGLLQKHMHDVPDVYLITPEVEQDIKDHLASQNPTSFWGTPEAFVTFGRLYGIPFEVCTTRMQMIIRALELFGQGKKACIVTNTHD